MAGRVCVNAGAAIASSDNAATNVTSKRLAETNMGGSPPEEATGRTCTSGETTLLVNGPEYP